MNQFKKIFRAVSASLPHGLLARTSHISLLLPYHHVVSDEYLPHIKGLYAYKNVTQFANDLDWLLLRYKTIHPDEVAKAILSGAPLPPNRFLLTFDDGFREIADTIAPILLRKGVPALFFINPAFIDNKELFYRCKLSLVLEKIKEDRMMEQRVVQYFGDKERSYNEVRKCVLGIRYEERQRADELGAITGIDFDAFLREHQPFLTTEQLLMLQSQGFGIGGHSIDHPHYKDLGLMQQLEQTVDSVAFAARFNASAFRYFAFPHQDIGVSLAFFEQMRSRCPSCLMFGIQNQRIEAHNHVLHRFNAENPTLSFPSLVKSMLLYNSINGVAGSTSVRRK